MLFKKAAMDDVGEIANLEKERFTTPYSSSSLIQGMRLLSARMLLAYNGEKKLQGYIYYSLAGDESEIYRLAVFKKDEGQGVGSALLAEALRQMEQEGVKTCYLEVRAGNTRAYDLYKKSGFEVYRVRKAYYENLEDARCMKKGLGRD